MSFISDMDGKAVKTSKIYKDEELAQVIEHAMGTVDMNNDGFIDYTEFKKNYV